MVMLTTYCFIRSMGMKLFGHCTKQEDGSTCVGCFREDLAIHLAEVNPKAFPREAVWLAIAGAASPHVCPVEMLPPSIAVQTN
jgi:hypothetical protein